jgi:ferritin
MALSKKVLDVLNEQVTHELESAYAYLAMSAYFEEEKLPGCALWMKLQSQEEVGHAMRIYSFIHDRDGHVVLESIPKPSAGFKSPLEAFQRALKQEEKITELIHRVYALGVKESDFPTQVMLQWFINEQVEEEKNVGDVVDQFKRIGNDATGLLVLDHQLGERKQEEDE